MAPHSNSITTRNVGVHTTHKKHKHNSAHARSRNAREWVQSLLSYLCHAPGTFLKRRRWQFVKVGIHKKDTAYLPPPEKANNTKPNKGTPLISYHIPSPGCVAILRGQETLLGRNEGPVTRTAIVAHPKFPDQTTKHAQAFCPLTQPYAQTYPVLLRHSSGGYQEWLVQHITTQRTGRIAAAAPHPQLLVWGDILVLPQVMPRRS